MYLQVITPSKKVFEGNIQKITLPGSSGSFQVLKDHAPIISTLQKGRIRYCNEGESKEYTLALEGGVVKVLNNHISILLTSSAS